MAVFHNHTCVAAGEGRRKMTVSLDFYKTFYYAAKYGSFTEAAKALYVTQPTVTHAISCLNGSSDAHFLSAPERARP